MEDFRIIDSIYADLNFYNSAEKKVAEYILANTRKVINMTISELAKESNTSVATVSRFCKKFSVGSFHHFKIALAREISTKELDISPSGKIDRNNMAESLQNILSNKIDELRATIDMIDEDVLSKILDAILNAKNIQILAIGNTIPVAMDFAFKLNELGIKTSAGPIWEGQLAFSLNLDKDDLLIAISNSGESKKVYEAVKHANSQGITTVGITNNINSAIGSEVKYHITTATREKLFLDEICFSRISASTVVEIIFLFLVNEIEDSHMKISKAEEYYADVKL